MLKLLFLPTDQVRHLASGFLRFTARAHVCHAQDLEALSRHPYMGSLYLHPDAGAVPPEQGKLVGKLRIRRECVQRRRILGTHERFNQQPVQRPRCRAQQAAHPLVGEQHAAAIMDDDTVGQASQEAAGETENDVPGSFSDVRSIPSVGPP